MAGVRGYPTSMDNYYDPYSYDGGASIYNQPVDAGYYNAPSGKQSPIGAGAGALAGLYAAHSLLGGGAAAAAAAPTAAAIAPAGAMAAAPSMMLPSVAPMTTGATSGLGATSTMGAVAPYAALALPLALAIGSGTFKKGHGDLGSDRDRYLNANSSYAKLSDAQKSAFKDAALKAGATYQTKNEIDARNPLAAGGREMTHFNFAKYLQPEGGIWGNGGRQQLSDPRSLAIQRGYYVPTADEIQNSPYIKGDKKTELLNALKMLQAPSEAAPAAQNNKVGGSLSNVATPSVSRTFTRSPGIDLNGNRINYANLSKAVAKKK